MKPVAIDPAVIVPHICTTDTNYRSTYTAQLKSSHFCLFFCFMVHLIHLFVVNDHFTFGLTCAAYLFSCFSFMFVNCCNVCFELPHKLFKMAMTMSVLQIAFIYRESHCSVCGCILYSPLCFGTTLYVVEWDEIACTIAILHWTAVSSVENSRIFDI